MKRLFLLSILSGAASVFAMPTPVSQLPASCTYNGNVACTKTYDATSGVCRTIRFSTSAGEMQLLVCDKGDRYELYRQSYPSGITFKACTGGGSVDQISGFSAFTSTTPGSGCATPTQPPAQSLVSPTSTGFGNQTRLANHDTLLGVWWNDSRLVHVLDCGTEECAWVPWYGVAHSCFASDLQPMWKCGGSGTPSATNNCMVTDEFSQVFLATAQGDEPGRVKQLFNTLRILASGANGGAFGKLPAWAARQTNEVIAIHSTDSASDADARILLALYIAASNPDFPETDRTTYRNYANEMAADFLLHDFRDEPRPGRNGVTIRRWLAAGGNAANGAWNSDHFSYAGYYGDAAIALLAAYKSLNQAQYLDAARDVINTYLLAADFNGSFRVPPKAFRWNLSHTPQKAECTSDCGASAWDDSDAPRATSICKAKYYATLLGVTLPADLDLYCNAWRSRGGLTSTTYAIQYKFDGTPYSGPGDGHYENGLALSLDFAYGSDLVPRLNQVGTKWNGSNGFWGQSCMGVYRSGFFITNLGSAIGRDLNAFR